MFRGILSPFASGDAPRCGAGYCARLGADGRLQRKRIGKQRHPVRRRRPRPRRRRLQQGITNPYYSIETITLSDGAQVDRVNINGPAEPPPGTELERAPVTPSALNQPGAAVSLPVPAYNWVFGCSAVSASMIGAYFDRNGLPNIYTGPGNGGVMPMDNSTVWGTWSGRL